MRNSYCVTLLFLNNLFFLIFMYGIRCAILAFILQTTPVFTHNNLCTRLAAMLDHELVYNTSIMRHIFSPLPQILKFQVKVSWNILCFLSDPTFAMVTGSAWPWRKHAPCSLCYIVCIRLAMTSSLQHFSFLFS